MNKYENLKNILLQAYNNTYNLIGGGKEELKTKIFSEIDKIGINPNIQTDKLYDNLQTYKENLQQLLDKTNEKIRMGERIKDIFNNSGNSVKEMEKLLDISQPKSLGSYLDKYKNFLQKYKFQNEFLTTVNGEEIININDPDKDVIIGNLELNENEESAFTEFNTSLLKIFYPYISNLEQILNKATTQEKKAELQKNIDGELDRIIELTTLSKQYESILLGKKGLFDKIINSEYLKDDIAFIDDNISEEAFKDNLIEKKIDPGDRINIDDVNNINKMIKDISNILEIKDSINDLSNLKINVDELKDDFDYVELIPKANWRYIQQVGGVVEFTDKYVVDINLDNKLVEFIKLLEKLFETIFVTINLSQELKELQLRYNYYVAYVFAIIKEESSESKRVIYKYINKQIIEKYHLMIKKIILNFDTNLKNPVIEYFNKYHYYTLKKLDEFLTWIISNYESNKIIDIQGCRNEVEIGFVIFNHFKDILDKPEVNFID